MSEELIKFEDIDQKHMPLIVFSDSISSFVGSTIKVWTKGRYNHVMMMISPLYFVSQEPKGYRKVPLSKYINDHTRLKFVKIDLTKQENAEIMDAVVHDLSLPWYKRMYDFVGVGIGQSVGRILPFMKKIQIPGVYFCSERVPKYYRKYINLPKNMSPKDFNKILKSEPKSSVLARYTPQD